jgi:hypothetical protein
MDPFKSTRAILVAILMIGTELAVLILLGRLHSAGPFNSFFSQLPLLNWLLAETFILRARGDRKDRVFTRIRVIYTLTAVLIVVLEMALSVCILMYSSQSPPHRPSIAPLAAYMAATLMPNCYVISAFNSHALASLRSQGQRA